MKRIIICFFSVLGYISLFNAQEKEDTAFREMAERMTYYGWSFNQPKDKKFLWWKRTNIWKKVLWQNPLFPSNRRYKKGRDLRPLKPWGEQTLRYGELLLQEAEADEIKKKVNNLATTTAKELAYLSNKVVNLDPLWNVYYKDKLTDFINFSEEPESYNDWGFKNETIYNKLKGMGVLDSLQEELELIKEKFKVSRNTYMPRGKRLIMYNEIIDEWEKFSSKVKDYEDIVQTLIHLDEANKYRFNIKLSRTDKEIIDEVMNKYKTLF